VNANIAERVSAMAARLDARPAFVAGRGPAMTFRQFDRLVGAFTAGLRSRGVAAGERVAVMVPPGVEFAGVTLALFRIGALPVLIDPGMGIRGLGRCIAEAVPSTFVGSHKANFARLAFRWGRPSIRRVIRINKFLQECASELLLDDLASTEIGPPKSAQADDSAAILFTSGSTGPAKGVVYTHGMFQEQVRLLGAVFQIEPGEVDLCTFPLFALFAPALGMTSVLPDLDPTRPARADPKKLIRSIQDHGVTNIFGSPALIHVLGRSGKDQRIMLPTVRRVISAGAPVPSDVVERMVAMLPPGTQVFTPYGATESLPVAVIGSDEILGGTRHATAGGAGVCVGRPVPGVEVRIIPTNDAPLMQLPPPLPVAEIGEITVRGLVVSRSYWNRPDADDLHKIPDGDTVWHRMGDLGYFDAQGRLWFCGRKSQRVVTSEGTLHTVCCEGVFNTHHAVFRTALVGAPEPVLCVELEPNARRYDRARLFNELTEIGLRFAPARQIKRFLIHPGFPVDIRHNAKINREKLARWAARRLR